MRKGFASAEEVENFLRPRLKSLSDPFLLPNMEAAVTRILAALDRGTHRNFRRLRCRWGDFARAVGGNLARLWRCAGIVFAATAGGRLRIEP